MAHCFFLASHEQSPLTDLIQGGAQLSRHGSTAPIQYNWTGDTLFVQTRLSQSEHAPSSTIEVLNHDLKAAGFFTTSTGWGYTPRKAVSQQDAAQTHE